MILFLLACEDAPKYDKFADVFEPSLTVNAGAVPPNGERLQVLVNPARVGQCRALPELTANVDGVVMTRLHGKVEKESYGYDRDCSVYEFELDASGIASRPVGEKSVVTVTDGVTTLALETKHLFAPRTLAVQGEVAAGGEVVLRWSPGGDVIATENSFAIELVVGEEKRRVAPVTVTVEEVRFTLPADVHGPVTAELLGTAGIAPPLVACNGAKTCSVSRVFLVPPVEIVVP